MAQPPPEVDEAALAWAVRTADPAFDDWDAFTAWLESHPANPTLYDAIVAAAAEGAAVEAARPATVAPVIDLPRSSRRHVRWWIGSAIAAGIAVTVGIGRWQERPQPYAIQTAAGTQRLVTIADGSRITLAGGTRLVLDRHDPRIATVVRGEALFDIRHDPSTPFRVQVDGRELVDLGTRFDVKHDRGILRIAVAEGAVAYEPNGLAVRLDAGQGLVATDEGVTRQAVDPGSVAGWRTGVLSYDGASFTEVAADLSRAMAVRVTAAPGVANRSFHGTLRIADLRRDPATLALLMGVSVVRTPQGWTLTSQ